MRCVRCGHPLDHTTVSTPWGPHHAACAPAMPSLPPASPSPQQKKRTRTIVIATIIGSAVGIAVIANVAIAVSKSSPSTVADAPTPRPAPRPPVASPPAPEIEASELVDEYLSNAVRADSLYGGRVMNVIGHVRQVGKDLITPYEPYVLVGDSSFTSVQCKFSPGNNAAIAALNVGQRVRLNCRVKGYMVLVQAEQCDFLPVSASASPSASTPRR